jgi:hypothetical protein
MGLEARIQNYVGSPNEDPGDARSLVVVLSRSKAGLGDLDSDPRWTSLTPDGHRVWTDDFANLLKVLHR